MSRESSDVNVQTDPELLPLESQVGAAITPVNVPQVGAVSSIDGQPGPIILINTGAANKGLSVSKSSGANIITLSIAGVTTAIQESSGPTVLDIGAVANGEMLVRSGTNIIGMAVPGGVTDGDKGDIVVSVGGTVWEIDAGVIVNADINASAAIDATKIADGSVTSTEFQFINTLASNAQTQLNTKAPIASPTFTGTVTIPTPFTIGAVSMTATGTELNFVVGVTSAIQTQLNAKQAGDTTLTALAAYNTNGLLTQTAADTFVGRSVAVHGDANLTISNGDGVAGNPTLNTIQGIKTSSSPQFTKLGLGAAADANHPLIATTSASAAAGGKFTNTSANAAAYASLQLFNDAGTAFAFFLNSSANASYGGANTICLDMVGNFNMAFATNDLVRMTLSSGGNLGVGVTGPTATLHLKAGTAAASTGPLKMNAGTNLTVAEAGSCEYDGVNFYSTIDTSSGRGAIPVEQYFHLSANGGTISTIANFFGATSNISLVASAYYVIEIWCYFLNSTAGTVTWTFTNSAAPTSQSIHMDMSPITGVAAPATNGAYLSGDVVSDATAAKALVTTGTLTTAVNHWAYFKIFLQNGTGTSLKIQATKLVGGTITPLRNSFWSCRRIAPGNIGTFAA